MVNFNPILPILISKQIYIENKNTLELILNDLFTIKFKFFILQNGENRSMKFNASNLIILLVLILCNCELDAPHPTLFEKLSADQTNVFFENNVEETLAMSVMNNNNIYAGGGVAIGDINNDNLQDFIVISNQEIPGLYLNEGNFKFKNISEKAGLKKSEGWSTGVVMEDINADGWLDIYISKGIYTDKQVQLRRNLLYINNKDNTFTEKAKEFGIDNSNPTIQSVFFDFDLDGDLDLYTLNQPVDTDLEDLPLDTLSKLRQGNTSKKNSDTFYLNTGNNRYKDVSKQMGIQNWGNGLGIGLSDLNDDGFTDIYITNDFGIDNFLYLNNKGKGFTDIAKKTLGHVSYFAMGCDLADINNDGLIDIFEVEMLPKERERSVLNMASMNRKLFENFEKNNFTPQYMRNTLQLNRGRGNFSEIAQIANVAKTDWSWGTLLMDADDDGYKDILITNGITNDIKNRDYARKGNKLAEQSDGNLTWEQHLDIIVSTKVPNYAFQNQQNTLFKDSSKDWGFNDEGFSNGFAYADFDNDGDLDLLVNNLEETPWIYKNHSQEHGNNSINFKLSGYAKNTNGIGAKITIYSDGSKQYAEHYTVRGFQSSSQHIVHFGLGNSTEIDSLKVVWPDGKMEKILQPLEANQVITLQHQKANLPRDIAAKPERLFKGISRTMNFSSIHEELIFDDFEREVLLPHKMSQLGPALSTADVNKDGIDDIYLGGAFSFSPTLYLSEGDKYIKSESSLWEAEKKYEDIAATFFDADKDGDNDLYVVSGSNEFTLDSDFYQDRLYINDGMGNFTKSKDKLPRMLASGGCVEAADIDQDGDQDLFVGTRMLPGKYPLSTASYILINEDGKFIDKTLDINKEITELGMVTSAKWSDFDRDGDQDLLVVGEWMGIILFENNNGKLKNISKKAGLENTEGWWFHIEEIDFDKDGDMDYLCGNIGENHKFKTSIEKPFQVFSDDFDENGTLDIVLAFYQGEDFYPVRGRDCSSEQMPFIAEKFPTFESFGNAKMEDVFGSKLKNAESLKANTFSSIILKNNNGKFEKIKLPITAQYSAVTGSAEGDFNADGINDLLIAGNMYHTEAETSKADASFGLCLIGDGNGNYEPMPLNDSGFYTPGDVKGLKMINHKGKYLVLVANNNAKFQSYLSTKSNNLQ